MVYLSRLIEEMNDPESRGTPLVRYGLAFCVVGVVVLLMLPLAPGVVGDHPFLLFSVAVMVSTLIGGLGPGLFATLLSAIAVYFLFVPPLYSLRIQNSDEYMHLLLFVIEGGLISVLAALILSAKRRAEESREEIRKSEERYRALLQKASDMIVVLDQNGEVLYESPSVEWLLGFKPEERVGRNVLDFVHPEDAKRIAREMARGETRKGPIEYRAYSKDGSLRYLEAVGRDLFDDPDVGGRVVNVRDVTERKLAEIRLRETDIRYRAMVERMPATIYTQKLYGDYAATYFSPQVEKMLGYSPQQFLSDPEFWRNIVHPDDREQVKAQDEYTNETGESFSAEYRVVDSDGRVLWVRDEAAVERDDEGRPLFWQGFLLDVTEKKQAEEALKESEERFRATFEQAAVGIAHIALDGRWVWVNQKLCEILGYTEEELRSGMDFQSLTHPDDLEDNLEQIRRLLAGEQKTFTMEKRYLCKNGAVVWANLTVSLVRDATGKPKYFISVVEDIAKRKEVEEELRRSVELLLALREMGQDLGATLDAEEICSRLLNDARSLTSFKAACIEVWDESGNTIVRRYEGSEELLDRTHDLPEAVAARREALERKRQRLLHGIEPSNQEGGGLTGLYVPFKGHARVIGMMEVYGSEGLSDSRNSAILDSLANQVTTALENAQLYAALEERERQLQELLAKLLGAQEEERRRVAYEVHDGLAQVAAAAHQHLQAFARRNTPEGDNARADLDLIVRLVRRTVTDARRIIANLRPTALDDFGLSAALALDVEKLREEGYEVEYRENIGEERLSDETEITLFRIAQEAIANLRKHANTSKVKIDLRSVGDETRLEIRDWGEGFELAEVSAGAGPGERIGLAGMKERASILGGALEVHSRPGEGTSVVAKIPLNV